MRYPKQKNIQKYSYSIGQMDGIDCSSFANEQTLRDACNLTSDGRPFWQTRPHRGRWHLQKEEQSEINSGLFVFNTPVSGACSFDEGLCWTTGSKIFIGGKELSGVVLAPTARKQLLPMGRDLFIVPDGVLLHKDEDDRWQTAEAQVLFNMNGTRFHIGGCNEDGEKRGTAQVCNGTADATSEAYDVIDTSVSPAVLRSMNADGAWDSMDNYGWYITALGIHEKFNVGDIVNITVAGQIEMKNACIFCKNTDTICVTGEIFVHTGEGQELTVCRPFPVIDYAVVCANRIWGCRYGENADGAFVNEIFCSALGDPLTWNRYGTGADDCYCASVGAPGSFTGAAVLYDDIVFFKENSVFCVSGTQPSDFRIAHNAGKGVRKGCERSIARLGSSIVYCGADGVYRTNGTYTVRLCDGFQPCALEQAVGGVIGEKYYLAAHTPENEKCMFVFTAGRDTYHRENNDINVQYFVEQRNCLYMLCQPAASILDDIKLYWMTISITDCNAPGKYTNCLLEEGKTEADYGYAEENDLQWYALTNELDCGTAQTKCIREVAVRFELGESALFCVELRTDRGERKSLGRFTGAGVRRRTLHVNALPCESVQLYFCGHGDCKISNVEILYEPVKGELSHV